MPRDIVRSLTGVAICNPICVFKFEPIYAVAVPGKRLIECCFDIGPLRNKLVKNWVESLVQNCAARRSIFGVNPERFVGTVVVSALPLRDRGFCAIRIRSKPDRVIRERTF